MTRALPARVLILAGALACLLTAGPASAADEPAAAVPAATAAGDDARWFIQLPPDAPVVYRGLANFDEAGMGSTQLLYPAPNLGGLLAAILTHGALVESAKKSQKEQLQATADKVLAPFRDILDKFSYRSLMERTLAKTTTAGGGRLMDGAGDAAAGTRVEVAPSFSMTQDQTAIVADSAVLILKPGATPETAYRTMVRVVSSGLTGGNPVAHWTANGGERLKEESARLVAEAIDLAFADAATVAEKDASPFRTIRYRLGSIEKIERSQVLSSRCGRLVIRTLRGALMSVPASPAPMATAADGCAPAPG